jgi:hypothetical protein
VKWPKSALTGRPPPSSTKFAPPTSASRRFGDKPQLDQTEVFAEDFAFPKRAKGSRMNPSRASPWSNNDPALNSSHL